MTSLTQHVLFRMSNIMFYGHHGHFYKITGCRGIYRLMQQYIYNYIYATHRIEFGLPCPIFEIQHMQHHCFFAKILFIKYIIIMHKTSIEAYVNHMIRFNRPYISYNLFCLKFCDLPFFVLKSQDYFLLSVSKVFLKNFSDFNFEDNVKKT